VWKQFQVLLTVSGHPVVVVVVVMRGDPKRSGEKALKPFSPFPLKPSPLYHLTKARIRPHSKEDSTLQESVEAPRNRLLIDEQRGQTPNR